MSEENLEMVRRSYAAYLRGDIQAMLADADPHLITCRAPPQPDAGIWHGPEGFLEAFANWVEGFDEFTVAAEEVIDANDAQVVVRFHQRAVGSQSRVPVEADFWQVYTFEHGKVVRLDIYASEGQALQAVEGWGGSC
jgi:ketosteroid isomerase-like protein